MNKKNKIFFYITVVIVASAVILKLNSKTTSSPKIPHPNVNQIQPKDTELTTSVPTKEETKAVDSNLDQDKVLKEKGSKFEEELKKFDMTIDQFNEFRVKLIAKNYRYKIEEIKLLKLNPKGVLEVSLKLNTTQTYYYINALVDKKTGIIQKTWGQTRYEFPQDPKITLPVN